MVQHAEQIFARDIPRPDLQSIKASVYNFGKEKEEQCLTLVP